MSFPRVAITNRIAERFNLAYQGETTRDSRMLENPNQRSRGESHERQSEVRVPSKELLRASGQVQSLSRALSAIPCHTILRACH